MKSIVPPVDAGRPLLFYDPDYVKYDFGHGHVLREARVELARDLIERLGLLAGAEERRPKPASEKDILALHDAAYVEAVHRLSREPQMIEPEFGLEPGDNPPFRGMYEAAALQVGATIQACESVARGEVARAYNLGGGFHHASRARASGFCIFNDVVIGIRRLLDHGVQRVLYVDIDAHHADGVQGFLNREPRVLKISLHEDGHFLFPGTGFVDEFGEKEGRGFSVNVPLPPRTGDAGWTHAFDSIVLPLADAFRPEVLFTQTGADAHAADPLTHLDLTTESYEHAGARFDEISRRSCAGRWIAVGGGGYDVTVAPRVWTLLFGALVGRRPANALPEDWLEKCRKLVRAEPPNGTLRDAPLSEREVSPVRAVQRVIDEVRECLFPFHGIA